MDKKQEFLKRLLATFKIEAEENISGMSADLIELEKNPNDELKAELIEIIFRAAHSLKGASRAVNLSEIESVCQSFESVMSALKNASIDLKPEIFDVLHQTVDIIKDILNLSEEGVNDELAKRISNVIKNLSVIAIGKFEEIILSKPDTNLSAVAPIAIGAEEENPNPKTPNTKPETRNLKPETRNSKPETSNTIRVSTKKLDNLLFQAEEMLSLKLTSIQQTQNLRNTLNKLNIWNKESSEVFSSVRNIKQSLEKIEKEGVILKEEQEIAKIIQFYEWGVSHIKILEDDLIELRKFSDREAYSSGVKIETLLDDVKEIITVPFSNLLDVFPKTVRDLSKEMGKEIDLSVIGDNTEIDRRILEEIRIPLLHLLRNCIDYGI